MFFQNIARTLGNALNNFKDLKMIVLASLKKLLSHATDDPNIKNEMERFSKNFLTILLNLYSTEKPQGSDEEAIHLSAFETLKVFIKDILLHFQ